MADCTTHSGTRLCPSQGCIQGCYLSEIWLDSSTHCVCVSAVSVEHALICKCGGFPSLRHNEVRDITADLLTETCPNVLNPHSNHCRVNHCHIVLQLPMIMFVLILLSPVLVLSPKDICGRSCLQSLLLHLC